MTMNLYIRHLLYMSHNLCLLNIYGIARDSLISIAITLAMNIFISCMYTPNTLNIELVYKGDKNNIM